MTMRRVLVAGAGGFIGHHLVSYLKRQGFWVRGVDLKHPEFEPTQADEYACTDLRRPLDCAIAMRGIDDVYQLAADMGGIGYITEKHAEIMRNNAMINAQMLEAARLEGVKRYLFTSSACVYPSTLKDAVDAPPLFESDAIPADPEPGYGWEKLFSEQMVQAYARDFGLDVRIVRFHTIYGPLGTYEGGKEKAPAALCRKIAEAKPFGEVEVWGDGDQTRTFCYVDDCVEGLVRIMQSGFPGPVNLGSTELVSVRELVKTIASVAGKSIEAVYDLRKPQGARGRGCDISRLREVTGWEPSISLREGIERTYAWIASRVNR